MLNNDGRLHRRFLLLGGLCMQWVVKTKNVMGLNAPTSVVIRGVKAVAAATSITVTRTRILWALGALVFGLSGCASDPHPLDTSASSPNYPPISGEDSAGSSPSLFAALLGESAESANAVGVEKTPLLSRVAVEVSHNSNVVVENLDKPLLDVGIIAFQPLMSSLARAQSPLVRKAEARYLPYVLKQTLERSKSWGVVRVMPGQHGSAELNVEGVLLASDGERLVLRIRASDSAGRLWVDREYRMTVSEQAYETVGREPFQALFRRIEADLYQAYGLLTDSQGRQLSSLALLTYGDRLLPDGFSRYYQSDALGVLNLQGLPAATDPMVRRVQQLRRYEYFFVDTADEQYQSLFASMQRTYHHWRQYSRELVVYMRDYQARQAGQSSGYRRGSLAAMNEVYSDYEWFRMQERYLKELSSGFNNQVLPTVLNLDDQVVHLEGGYDDQYQQWQSILSEIYQLERGDY
ncbi:MAG: hypothetical protein ACRBBW_03405 [Cellvibrionaceae bacterium]